MKTKSKILTCLGAMALATVAILPSSAMAGSIQETEHHFTTDPFSFKANQYEALKWCDRGFKEKGANCCSTHKRRLGHPGHIEVITYEGTQYLSSLADTVCTLDVKLDS